MRFSSRQRIGWPGASIPVMLAIVAGLLVLPAAPAMALDSEVDGTGFARLAVPDVADASELWVEVEAPTLTAANTVLMVNGVEFALRSTALGAGAILPYTGASVELAVGVAATASPDVAITVLDVDGAVLFSDHSRIALTPMRSDAATPPGGPGPVVTPPGSTTGGDPSATAIKSADRTGALSDTGSDVFVYLTLAMLAVALGAVGVFAARKKVQR